MSPNRRIFLNVVATYGRTVIGALCGIFSTRWVLMALGKEDFGLFGLIASLVQFLSFFNIQFAGALSRFYAYSVGQAKVAFNASIALEECRKWFSVGIVLHTIIPLTLVLVGYPVGIWAINSGLIGVPHYRIGACVWLWRFVCISGLISMLNVPFNAMYVAKQYIAELTIYSLVQTIVRTVFIYCMTVWDRDWLITYGLSMCLISLVPQVVICMRAVIIFPECRLCQSYKTLGPYVKRLASYAGWQMFGGLGYLARHQFQTVVVNRFFGPRATASFSIGGTVSAEAAALTGAFNAAFAPAITTAYGEGNWIKVKEMTFRACKFGTLLTLLFAIPLAVEIDEILTLWLKDVPVWANGICALMLIIAVVEKFTIGHVMSVNASGRVALFQVFHGLAYFFAIPFSLFAIIVVRHVYAVCSVILLTTCLACVSDVWFARKRLGLSVRYWFFHIVVPITVVGVIVCWIGTCPRYFMGQSFLRVIVTSFVSVVALLPLAWFVVLNAAERSYIYKSALGAMQRFKESWHSI